MILFISFAFPVKASESIIIGFKKTFDPSVMENYAKERGWKKASRESLIVSVIEEGGCRDIRPHFAALDIRCVEVPDGINITEKISYFSSLPFVEYAEPNYRRKAGYTLVPGGPDDTYYQNRSQWGYNKIQEDKVFAESLIPPDLNRLIVVAVIDTGLRREHSDISGTTVNGINAIDGSTNVDDDAIEGHGTLVSGVVIANVNSASGIAGAAYSNGTSLIKVMPVKALDEEGFGHDADIYYACVWAADHGANVINMSFGGSYGGITLQNAVAYAAQKGCVLVASSGNSGINEKVYPAAYSQVISVGASDENDNRAAFSTYGKVDLTAPGVGITTTSKNSGYESVDGTSFSAPFVSALAAQVILLNYGIKEERVRKIMQMSADDIGDPGYDIKTGWGRINAYKALTENPDRAVEMRTYNWPNPFSPDRERNTTITYVLSAPAETVITIYDAAGDIVWKKTVDISSAYTGYNYVKWDGKTTSGRKAGNGTYFYTISSGALRGKNKITVLH
ncbi:MAG: S8 family serine peptidase [Candidatus Goldbacteria bacterium]|nr:S8 family serine peptidase [Candidatus Goldiibacteriota bacterium]